MKMQSFARDFISYAVLSVVSTLIIYAMMSSGTISVGGIIFGIILMPLMWLLPLAVFVLAVKRGGKGRVLGALCGIPALLLWQDIHMRIEAHQIMAENQRQFLPVQQTHDLIGIENSYFSEMNGADGCSEYCLQILFEGRHVVAVKDRSTDLWRVFRLAHGKSCYDSPKENRYLELLQRRYADVCISMSEGPPPTDALVIREYFYRELSNGEESRPFNISKREFLERINGNDTLLGRWVSGQVEPTSTMFYFLGLGSRNVGDPIDDWEFYEAALGFPIQKIQPRGSASVGDVLTGLKPLFDNPETAKFAMYSFQDLVSARTPQDAEQLRTFLQARIDDLKASPNPDPERIHWFESWIGRI